MSEFMDARMGRGSVG